jgi:hypothetical protein
MWGLIPRVMQVQIIVITAILLAWALEALHAKVTGVTVSPFHYMSLTAIIVAVALAGAASFLWRPLWRRFPWIEKHTFPDLTGVWTGDLISTWVDPETKQPKPPIPTTITITQGLFTTSVKLRTGESTSYSTRCYPEAFPSEGRFRIWYTYANEPKAKFRFRSAPHNGLAWLELDYDGDKNKLVGMYYTDRKTTGDIEVTRTSRAPPA